MNGTEQENGSNGPATARTKRVLSKEFDRVANGSTPAKYTTTMTTMTTTSNGGVIHDDGDGRGDEGEHDDRENDSSSSEAFASTKSDDGDDDTGGEETEEKNSAPSAPPEGKTNAAFVRRDGGGVDDGSVNLFPALLASSLLVGVAYLGSLHVVLVEADLDPTTDGGGVEESAYRHGALCLAGALLIMAVKSAVLVRIVLPALLPISMGGRGGVFGRLCRRLVKFAFGSAIIGLVLLCDWVLVTECMDAVNGEMLK